MAKISMEEAMKRLVTRTNMDLSQMARDHGTTVNALREDLANRLKDAVTVSKSEFRTGVAPISGGPS